MKASNMTASDLWTAYEAAAATGGALCARGGKGDDWPGETWTARGISIDSRSIRPGDIFVALKAQRDGHEFVKSAFSAGASAALVSRAPEETPDGAPLLVVGDTLQGLRDLAVSARDRSYARRVAVTGSAGKTSTKDMLRAMLAEGARVHAADRSFNNHFGVPLTLAQLPMDADYAVFEIGMNHAGEIEPLAQLVRPHAAIVTTVASAHLEFFESEAAIAAEKASIFKGLRPGGAAILPADNPHFALLANAARDAGCTRLVTFGAAAGADYRMLDYRETDAGGVAKAEVNGASFDVRLQVAGRHQAMNALAALAAAEALGASRETLLAGLAGHSAGAGRGLRFSVSLPGGDVLVIDESYNANPASMTAAIAQLASAAPGPGGRRIAVIGEMLELGAGAAKLHEDVARQLVDAKVDIVYAAGALTRHLWDALPDAMRGAQAQTATELSDAIVDALKPGDVVMAKGSNASRIGDVVRRLETRAGPAKRTGT